MKKSLTMLMVSLFLCVGTALAQTKVTGTVLSQEDGQPIIGAAVKVDGTSTGMLTDVNGKFSLTLPEGKKSLTISYLGYEAKTVIAKNGMRVFLKSDATALEEVVVTAMGIKRSAKALGYSATSLDGEEIAEVRTNDIMSGLAGKVAGVQISTTSSDPGASNSVIIRGVSSLNGSNQPLYVIDGVPMTNSSVYSSDGLNNGYDFGNGANAVNPDDVENMTILKGAAATALYGSRAANGVILITTKSGKKQNGVGVEYNGGLQWESVLRLPQSQNDFGMGWYGNKTDDENGSWGPKFDGSTLRYGSIYDYSQKMKSYVAIKDNMKDFFDTGMRYNNSVSFSNATDATTYYVSLSQIHDDGIIPTSADSYTKYTFSANGSQKVKNVTISTALNYAYQKNSFVSTGQGGSSMYNAIMQTPRDISIAEMKDLSDPFNTPGYYYTPYGITNPYWILNNYENKQESERFYGKLQLDYEFLNYFKATYRFGLDTQTRHHNQGEPNLESMFKDTYNADASTIAGATGAVTQQTTRQREINQDFFVTFDMPVSDFNINAVAGFNGNERSSSYLYGHVENLTIPTFFDLSNSSERPEVAQYSQKRRLYGIYGQAELAWKNMAYLTVTARNDWSSTLPKENRSFFYPGVTASFLFSELFKEDMKKIINFGKVRAAWGKTGNDASVYMTQSVYAQASSSSSGWASSAFPFSKTGTNAYTAGNTLGSLNLSPEMTTEFELGLNMGFLQNRIVVDFSYYDRKSDKQIFSLNMDPASGYTAMNTNLGKIGNKGIEALITLVPVRTKDFEWAITWNYTKNKNKVISLPEELGGEVNIYGFSGGTGLYAIEGEEMGIFKCYRTKTDGEGHIVVNNKGIPLQTDDIEKVGSMNYKYQMGIGNTFRYKGVSLGIDFDIRKGGLLFSRTADISYFTGNAMQTAYNDRNPFIIPNSVQSDGNGGYVENTTPLDPTQIYNFWNNGGFLSDESFLLDKSYVKLRSVVLSWELPKKWLSGTPLQGVKVSFFGNNLFLWTPSSNTFIDPELTSFGNDLSGNFGEYSANPSSRKFGFNVNVKF
ncbi:MULTISPECIES: SusC/RagA family TonB-linked outer membrane protein [Prevotellaceae]|uniref:SusC/RagA family TonB-linked outer membrane protein n=1 Tax=Prevotellaceae TaxID=171552 RepID=UPI000B819923|nr:MULTISPECIES: SusC/RagA family TonB-linked outer membrane protein [Prevotellaceae]QVJ80296.1 SusC/RagA family TonB-linked outer membrane protein [Xylanibacter ruminicola]